MHGSRRGCTGTRWDSAARRSATFSTRLPRTRRSRSFATPTPPAFATSTPRRITATAFPKAGSVRRCAASHATKSFCPRRWDESSCPTAPRRANRTAMSMCCRTASAGTIRARERCARSTTACSAWAFRGSTSSTSTTSITLPTEPPTPQRLDQVYAGAIPALAKLREDGVVGGFGLGVNDWRVCVEVLARVDLDIVLLAGRYTLLDQSALAELLPLCAAPRRRYRRRRSLQFRHSRHRRASGRRQLAVLRLCAGAARAHRARCRDRSRLRRIRRAAPCCGAAVSAGASHRRQRHPRCADDSRIRPESRARDPCLASGVLAGAAPIAA